MGLSEEFAMTTFQSRFGPKNGLQPLHHKTVEKLAKDKVEHFTNCCARLFCRLFRNDRGIRW